MKASCLLIIKARFGYEDGYLDRFRTGSALIRIAEAYVKEKAVSALFAALTSILAKIGIGGVESNLGTAIQNGVVSVVVPIDKK